MQSFLRRSGLVWYAAAAAAVFTPLSCEGGDSPEGDIPSNGGQTAQGGMDNAGSHDGGTAGTGFETSGGGVGQAAGGSAEAGAGGRADGPIVITGEHFGFVFDSMTYPITNTEAREVAFDIDRDGAVDNAFGKAMSTLAVQGFDINGAINTAILGGQLLMLGDLQASSLSDTKGAAFSTYLGADPMPVPCSAVNDCGHHLDGTGTFTIATTTPEGVACPGSMEAGVFLGQGGALPVRLLLGAPADVVLHDAQVELTNVSEAGFTAGRLGGAISSDDLNAVIFPSLLQAFLLQVSGDCTGAGPGCGCVDGSPGKQQLDLFDTDKDCNLTLAELTANTLIQATFAPDLDTDGNGAADSLSIGFAITGKGGTFALIP